MVQIFLCPSSLSLFKPLLSLPHYLCPSLPKSFMLQQTLFFNPIWSGPPPPTITSLLHGGMYANVARLQKWKLVSSHSGSSQRQCCSIVPQQTPNRKIRTCQIWSAMNHASLATELKCLVFMNPFYLFICFSNHTPAIGNSLCTF